MMPPQFYTIAVKEHTNCHIIDLCHSTRFPS